MAIYKWVFVAFVVAGAVTRLNVVWNVSCIMNLLMAVSNLLALLLLSGTVATEKTAYFSGLRGEGIGQLKPKK